MSGILRRIFTAVLFTADEPLPMERMMDLLAEAWEAEDVQREFQAWVREWNAVECGIGVVPVAGGYQFRTDPEVDEWVRRFKTTVRAVRLSKAALETLAIIAYRQPITTPEIEHIRGISSGGVLKSLLEKGLVTVLGRRQVAGRPLVYGTSKRFLEEFGLFDLTDLPDIKEIEKLFEKAGQEEILDDTDPVSLPAEPEPASAEAGETPGPAPLDDAPVNRSE
ncbi:SMC-Scp complex subunit ScpB [bacterium]|nr:SMC-Scp complex subunit ScpB [candidate division CSSED10-310 bacterium]